MKRPLYMDRVNPGPLAYGPGLHMDWVNLGLLTRGSGLKELIALDKNRTLYLN